MPGRGNTPFRLVLLSPSAAPTLSQPAKPVCNLSAAYHHPSHPAAHSPAFPNPPGFAREPQTCYNGGKELRHRGHLRHDPAGWPLPGQSHRREVFT